MESEHKSLMDNIYRSRIRRAREMTPAQRLVIALELQDQANQMMRNAVRIEFPGIAEADIDAHVARKQRRLRAVSDLGIFQPVAA